MKKCSGKVAFYNFLSKLLVLRCLDTLVLQKFKRLSEIGRVTVSGSGDRQTSINGRVQYIADVGNEQSLGQSYENDTNRPQEGNVYTHKNTRYIS